MADARSAPGPELQGPSVEAPAERRAEEKDPLRRSRTSRTWVTLVLAGVLMILLIIFIAQNTQRVEVSFLGWDGHPPLAVALLVAAVASLLVTSVAGTLRIVQLRRRVRRSR